MALFRHFENLKIWAEFRVVIDAVEPTSIRDVHVAVHSNLSLRVDSSIMLAVPNTDSAQKECWVIGHAALSSPIDFKLVYRVMVFNFLPLIIHRRSRKAR
jgi:hypothetical protein